MNLSIFKFLPLFLIILLTSSCASNIYRAYEGEPLSKNEIATVMIYDKSSYDIIIHSLDDKNLKGLFGASPKHIEVEPGLHTFTVGFTGYKLPNSNEKNRYGYSAIVSETIFSEDTADISFFAKPGKTYLIDIKMLRKDGYDVYDHYWAPVFYECD